MRRPLSRVLGPALILAAGALHGQSAWAMSFVVQRSSAEAPCVAVSESFELVSDVPYTDLQWTVSGPHGVSHPTGSAGVPWASFTYPQSGNYTVTATAVGPYGEPLNSSLIVVVPRPRAIIIVGSPGALSLGASFGCQFGPGSPFVWTYNDKNWCWFKKLASLAESKLTAAGWDVTTILNATEGEISAALEAGPCVQGLFIIAHGSTDGWIQLAATAGVFSDTYEEMYPNDLLYMMLAAGAWNVRHLTLLACGQDLVDWQSAVWTGDVTGPSQSFPEGMKSGVEYRAMRDSNHGIWSADAPTEGALPVGSLLAGTGCTSDYDGYVDYDFWITRDAIGYVGDPFAPESCNRAEFQVGAAPTALESPEQRWSVVPFLSGTAEDTRTIAASSYARLPRVSSVDWSPWPHLVVAEESGEAAIDSLRVTIRFTPEELGDIGLADVSDLTVVYMSSTQEDWGILVGPTTRNIATGEIEAVIPGPGIVKGIILEPTDSPIPVARRAADGIQFTVAPLPARDVIRLQFAGPVAGEVRLELIAVTGRRVLTSRQQLSGVGVTTLRLPEGLAAGVYFLRCVAAGDVAVRKVVVAK